MGADLVQGEGILASQQESQLPGLSRGGAVSLHGHHRVHQVEPRTEKAREIGEHLGKVGGIGEAEVVLGLHGAGDGAEEVLHRSGHAHHAVGLELAEVDDGVAVGKPLGISKLVEHRALGKVGIYRGAVEIEGRPRLLDHFVAAQVVDPLQKGRGEEPAGAVAHHHLCTPGDEQLRERRHQQWVGGDGLLRRRAGDQIDLDGDFHARRHPGEVAAGGLQGALAGGIVGQWGKTHLGQGSPLLEMLPIFEVL